MVNVILNESFIARSFLLCQCIALRACIETNGIKPHLHWNFSKSQKFKIHSWYYDQNDKNALTLLWAEIQFQIYSMECIYNRKWWEIQRDIFPLYWPLNFRNHSFIANTLGLHMFINRKWISLEICIAFWIK